MKRVITIKGAKHSDSPDLPTKTLTGKGIGAPDYHTPVEVKISASDARKFFDLPSEPSSKLRFTDVSIYSTTPHDQAEYTANLLLNYYTPEVLKTKIVTEANACIGGMTWSLAKHTKLVNAIELNPLHAEILRHNLKLYNLSNINVIEGNCIPLLKPTKSHILFLDPSWGGANYKKEKNIVLSYEYNGKPYLIDDLVHGYLSYLVEMIIIKLPYGYDTESLKNSNFLTNVELPISTDAGKPIYTLLILSHIKPTTTPKPKTFPKFDCRTITQTAL